MILLLLLFFTKVFSYLRTESERVERGFKGGFWSLLLCSKRPADGESRLLSQILNYFIDTEMFSKSAQILNFITHFYQNSRIIFYLFHQISSDFPLFSSLPLPQALWIITYSYSSHSLFVFHHISAFIFNKSPKRAVIRCDYLSPICRTYLSIFDRKMSNREIPVTIMNNWWYNFID